MLDDQLAGILRSGGRPSFVEQVRAQATVRRKAGPVLLSDRVKVWLWALPPDMVKDGLLLEDAADALRISLCRASQLIRLAGWWHPRFWDNGEPVRFYPPWAPPFEGAYCTKAAGSATPPPQWPRATKWTFQGMTAAEADRRYDPRSYGF